LLATQFDKGLHGSAWALGVAVGSAAVVILYGLYVHLGLRRYNALYAEALETLRRLTTVGPPT
jgi:hypothetical protein